MHIESGVTDINTAKQIAKKLYGSYMARDKVDKGMENMMVDTYKIMNKDFKPTVQDVEIFGQVLDFDGDGQISLEDFQALAVKFLAKPEAKTYTRNVKQRLEVAKRLFLKFDRDQSGYLSEDEIPNLLRETYSMMGMEYTPTKEDTASWMKMTDSDGDGKVTLEDYERLIITSLQRCGIKIYERE